MLRRCLDIHPEPLGDDHEANKSELGNARETLVVQNFEHADRDNIRFRSIDVTWFVELHALAELDLNLISMSCSGIQRQILFPFAGQYPVSNVVAAKRSQLVSISILSSWKEAWTID